MLIKKSLMRYWLLVFCGLIIGGGWCFCSSPGLLLVLDGPSSSGKSSVARELKKKLDSYGLHFRYESLDDFNERKWEKEQRKKKGKKPKKLREGSESYQGGYLRSIKKLADQGENVLADTVIYDEQDVNDYQSIIGTGGKTVSIMVYCPFIEIPQRVDKRNHCGIEDEERSLRQAINQIPVMFELTSFPSAGTIDSFTRYDVQKILALVDAELEEENTMRNRCGKSIKDALAILQHLKNELMPHKGDLMYVQVRMPHDVVVVNAAGGGVMSCAQRVIDVLKERNILTAY